MDLVFIGALALAAFIIFLMATAKRRRHYLEDAMRKLTTRRMMLMKEVEKVKLLQESGDMSEREAFTHLSHIETELAEVQRKLIELKEKPLARTLKKQEEADATRTAKESGGGKAEKEVVQEGFEAERAEARLMANLDAKFVVAGFAVVLILITFMVVSSGSQMRFFEASPGVGAVTLAAIGIPEGGTYPGGVAAVRVEVMNEGEEDVKNLVLGAFAPEDSELLFEGRPYFYYRIPELRAGGLRDIPIRVSVGSEALDGEYVIMLQLSDPDKLINKNTTAKISVRFGAELEEAERGI